MVLVFSNKFWNSVTWPRILFDCLEADIFYYFGIRESQVHCWPKLLGSRLQRWLSGPTEEDRPELSPSFNAKPEVPRGKGRGCWEVWGFVFFAHEKALRISPYILSSAAYFPLLSLMCFYSNLNNSCQLMNWKKGKMSLRCNEFKKSPSFMGLNLFSSGWSVFLSSFKNQTWILFFPTCKSPWDFRSTSHEEYH